MILFLTYSMASYKSLSTARFLPLLGSLCHPSWFCTSLIVHPSRYSMSYASNNYFLFLPFFLFPFQTTIFWPQFCYHFNYLHHFSQYVLPSAILSSLSDSLRPVSQFIFRFRKSVCNFKCWTCFTPTLCATLILYIAFCLCGHVSGP